MRKEQERAWLMPASVEEFIRVLQAKNVEKSLFSSRVFRESIEVFEQRVLTNGLRATLPMNEFEFSDSAVCL